MRRILQIFLLFVPLTSSGQYYSDMEIDRHDLSAWKVNSTADYSGVYLFGISEGESELRLFITDSSIVAQTRSFVVNESTGGFKDTFLTFSGVSISGNIFTSDQVKGEFVIYKYQNKSLRGLLIHNPWTYKFNSGGEFGAILKSGSSLPGDYPFASTRLLSEKELLKYTSRQLRVMRNEIFARYGLIFEKDGEMDKYFSGKVWYHRNYQTADGWLTSIELANIETIKKAEAKK